MKSTHISNLSLIFSCFFLMNCGGGSDTPTPSAPPSAPTPVEYTVTVNTQTGGSAVEVAKTVLQNNTTQISINVDEGFSIGNIDGCALGALAGNVYTTGQITESCTISIDFIADITGQVRIVSLENATVNVYELPDKTLIANTQIKADGKFTIKGLRPNSDLLYLIESIGGQGFRTPQNGNASEKQSVEGSLSGIFTAEQLGAKPQLSVLTDIVTLYSSQTPQSEGEFIATANSVAENFVTDINNDGITNYIDLLALDESSPQSLTSNIERLTENYLSGVFRGVDEKVKYGLLLDLLNTDIQQNQKAFTITPFTLSPGINNIPSALTIEWKFNQTKFNPQNGIEVIDGGAYTLVADIMRADELVRRYSRTSYAATATPVASTQTKTSEDVLVDISAALGAGASLFIPASASITETNITVSRVFDGSVPINGQQVSDTIVLSPAGSTFEKPITVSIPYDAGIPVEQLRVVRFSENGDVDYITPSHVDERDNVVYFETSHFSTFVVESFCVIEACERLERNFNKIKEILAAHYDGDIDFDDWDDERWELVLNTSLDGASGDATIYDAFLRLNKVRTLVDVIDNPNFVDDNNPDGINQDARYFAAYRYLYEDDATVRASQERYEDISAGINVIQSIASADIDNVVKSSIRVFAANLGMLDAPPQLSNAINNLAIFDYTNEGLSPLNATGVLEQLTQLLNIPVYNPVEVGGSILRQFNNIEFQRQVRMYFQFRITQPLSPRLDIYDISLRAQSAGFDFGGADNKRWFTGGSYSSVSDLSSFNFFNNVEDMYQYYQNYKAMHEQDSLNKNSCGSQSNACEEHYFELTPEAGFVALFLGANDKQQAIIDEEYYSDNPSFEIEQYEVNEGIRRSASDLRDDIELTVIQGSLVNLRMYLSFQSDAAFEDNFDPTITANDLSICGTFSCDEAVGLITLSYAFKDADGQWYINIQLDPSDAIGTKQYELDIRQERRFAFDTSEFVNLTIITEASEQTPKTILSISPEAETLFRTNKRAEFAVSNSLDAQLNSYYWEVFVIDENDSTNNQTVFEGLTNEDDLRITVPVLDNEAKLEVHVQATDVQGRRLFVDESYLILPSDNTAPVAIAGDDVELVWGEQFTIDASASYDNETESESLTFEWRQIDDTNTRLINDLNKVNSALTFPWSSVIPWQTFEFEIYVSDIEGNTGTDTVSVFVKPPANESGYTAGEDVSVSSAGRIYLEATQIASDRPRIKDFIWVQQDSSGINVDMRNWNQSRMYFEVPEVSEPTIFTFTLILTDIFDVVSFSQVNVTVGSENTPPVADAGENITVNGGDTVRLSALGSSDDYTAADDLEYSWFYESGDLPPLTLNDSATGLMNFEAPILDETRIINFYVNVLDEDGLDSRDYVSVTVFPNDLEPAIPTFVSLNPRTVVAGTPNVTFTITGTNFPDTLAMALQDSNSCGSISIEPSKTVAKITCGIPDTSETFLWFSIKDKPALEGGEVISNADGVGVTVLPQGSTNGLIAPCTNCGYSGPFDREWFGDNTEHLAQDYPAFVGDEIIAMARGRVMAVYTEIGGFGGALPNRDGGAIIIQHVKADGNNFQALYGHVIAVSGLEVGDKVQAGEVIGSIGNYYVYEGSALENWPHLHLGIWDSESDFPSTQLGYGPIRNFVDPVPFMANTTPETVSEIFSISPVSATQGASTTFTATGKDIPQSIAMSLAGSLSCTNVYDISEESAKIDCVPNIIGTQPFYINNKSGGVFIPGSELLTIAVSVNANEVLGVSFTDGAFAQCVQEYVDVQQVSSLAELTTLNCVNRGLMSVDELSHMTGLRSLYIQNNALTAINLDSNQSLETAYLFSNAFNGTTLNYLSTVSWISNLTYLQEPQTVTGKLNDTGITKCANASSNTLDCPVSEFPNQDAENGRDAQAQSGTLTKVGAGHGGFDFTKLDASGEDLPATATSWSCVRDNHTGFVWEIKTDDDGLQDKDNTYTWYNSTGINDGYSNGGICPDAGNCDTEKYIETMNANGLCGFTDWRLPKRETLRSIVRYDNVFPAVDSDYFPSTQNAFYWSSSNLAGFNGSAWVVHFGIGSDGGGGKNNYKYVRLVRGNR